MKTQQPQNNERDEIIQIIKTIIERGRVPRYVTQCESLQKMASGQARFQCKYCYSWSCQSNSKKHNKSESCLFELNIAKLKLLRIKNYYPCMLCFKKFQFNEIGNHYVQMHV